jgi:hypothetical protein
MPERGNYIASPLALKMLDMFGVIVWEALDTTAYMVGSVLERPDYRDVDVRAILTDETFARIFGEETDWRRNQALKAHNLAFSALGQKITGLPVDFQIESFTKANEDEHANRRHPLGASWRARLAEGSEPDA